MGAEEFPAENESWKSEISSRLDTYRSRSKRKLSGDFSMRFNFDGELAGPRQQICVPALPEVEPEPAAEEVVQQVESPVEEPPVVEEQVAEPAPVAAEPEPPRIPPLRPSVPFKRKVVMEANVIEFPRLFPPEPMQPYTVAEPVLPSSPRILDAPEIAQPLLETPILDGMRLEQANPEPVPAWELPLQAASISKRLHTSMADGLIVLLASGIFGVIVHEMLPGLELSKPMIGAAALVPAIFWALYQYLFIVYGARTPGMALTHLAFSTFDGTAPNLRQRRKRVIGMAVSCSSLMLGFLWAWFDEDTLCWHDRISRTYSFEQKS